MHRSARFPIPRAAQRQRLPATGFGLTGWSGWPGRAGRLLLALCLPFAAIAQTAANDSARAAAGPAGGSIEVAVAPVRNSQGGLGCQLFDSAEGFPLQGERALQAVLVPIANGAARCRFDGLPPGRYAVAVVHDENSNRKLDTNVFGLPTEGYGVSNNRTYAMSAPRWDESRIELAAGQAVQLAVQLRY